MIFFVLDDLLVKSCELHYIIPMCLRSTVVLCNILSTWQLKRTAVDWSMLWQWEVILLHVKVTVVTPW